MAGIQRHIFPDWIKNTQDPEKRKELINDIKEGKINKSEKDKSKISDRFPDIVKRIQNLHDVIHECPSTFFLQIQAMLDAAGGRGLEGRGWGGPQR